MPTKEELEKENQDLIKKNTRLEKQLEKCKKKDSNGSIFLRLGVGLPLIIGSRFIPNTGIKTNWFSGDLLVIAGIALLLLPSLVSVYKAVKLSK